MASFRLNMQNDPEDTPIPGVRAALLKLTLVKLKGPSRPHKHLKGCKLQTQQPQPPPHSPTPNATPQTTPPHPPKNKLKKLIKP